jgi:hypothetical protein
MREYLGINEQEDQVAEDEEVDLDQEEAKRTPGGATDAKEDPYLQLGFGMCAYFNLLRSFILLFALLTFLAVPAIGIYSARSGLKDLRNYDRSQYSVGNLGFSDSICETYYIGITSPIKFS